MTSDNGSESIPNRMFVILIFFSLIVLEYRNCYLILVWRLKKKEIEEKKKKMISQISYLQECAKNMALHYFLHSVCIWVSQSDSTQLHITFLRSKEMNSPIYNSTLTCILWTDFTPSYPLSLLNWSLANALLNMSASCSFVGL